MRWKSQSGQAATENLAVISVLVIAIVGATYTFVPTFSDGVGELAKDASQILATGKIGDTGTARNGGAGDAGRSGSGTSGINPIRGCDPACGSNSDAGATTQGASGSNNGTINNGPHSHRPGSDVDPIGHGLGTAMPSND